jgi:hypothetical protein
MKLTTLMLILLAQASAAQTHSEIQACVQTTPNVSVDLPRAKYLSAGLLASAGVALQWIPCGQRGHRPDLIVIEPRNGVPEFIHPGALAYAMAFTGTQIVVMPDRVKKTYPEYSALVLAYVLAHELAHVLSRTESHSASGIMKANWNLRDLNEMVRGTLGFTADDIQLIQSGLASGNRSLNSDTASKAIAQPLPGGRGSARTSEPRP